jgi:hypothetical protein
MPARIFISYRRDDAAGDAGRLADHLKRRFGPASVFLDIDAIEPGTDFVRVLRASIEQTAAVLVVIGPRWTSLRNADGTRRLDSPDDFVRLEVEAALGRNIPVVPVLVQGAAMPSAADLPGALAALATRQAAAIDHAEFHADAERLCAHLSTLLGRDGSPSRPLGRRLLPIGAAAIVMAVALAGYYLVHTRGDGPPSTTPDGAGSHVAASGTPGASAKEPSAPSPATDALLVEASAQRRRGQLLEALATLARARDAAPASEAVRQAQEGVAMEWIRNVRVEGGKGSFGDAIKPAVAVLDASLPSASGTRRADLLAHQGWATFLLWRDGNRQLNPTDWYRDALSIDPGNPYANAMQAHWVLFQDDNVPQAVKLFDTALQSGREKEAVRLLQWAGYNNAKTPESEAERLRVADAMRREGAKLTMGQAQALWAPYYFDLSPSHDSDRQTLLSALPPDDHISTMRWAFEEYAAKEPSRRLTMRFYEALLHEKAGRVDQAVQDLRALNKELSNSPGSLQDAVQRALRRLQGARARR